MKESYEYKINNAEWKVEELNSNPASTDAQKTEARVDVMEARAYLDQFLACVLAGTKNPLGHD